MTALTAPRDTRRYGDGSAPPLIRAGLAAAAKVYAGSIACINAAGKMVPGGATAAFRTVGRARKTFDNTGGLVDAVVGEAERGVFYFASPDITAADLLKLAYVVDDQTVSISSSAGTRPVAGRILDFDSVNGPGIEMGSDFLGGA